MNNQKLIEIRKNIEKVIIGKSENIDLILTALLAGGHVLLDDVPWFIRDFVGQLRQRMHYRSDRR